MSALLVMVSGCAEGPFYKLGALNPWVRRKWAEEERIVQSFYLRRQQLRDLASRASSIPVAEQERISEELAVLLREDPVTLLRVEVVRSLAAFPTARALTAIQSALADNDPSVRIAACEMLGQRRDPASIGALQHVLGSDSDVDVRLAATRALGAFQGQEVVQALGLALNDADPALQRAAIQSLRTTTGQNLGNDVIAWREYLRTGNPPGGEAPSVVDAIRNWF